MPPPASGCGAHSPEFRPRNKHGPGCRVWGAAFGVTTKPGLSHLGPTWLLTLAISARQFPSDPMPWTVADVFRSGALFILAGLAEIGGGWLVWQHVRGAKPWWWTLIGAAALIAYGFIPTLQPAAASDDFGRVSACYGGVFIGSGRYSASASGGRRACTAARSPCLVTLSGGPGSIGSLTPGAADPRHSTLAGRLGVA